MNRRLGTHKALVLFFLLFTAVAEIPGPGHPDLKAYGADIPPVLQPFPLPIFFPVRTGTSSALPSSKIAPLDPIFDFDGVPGWVQNHPLTNAMGVSIPKFEILVIKGTRIDGKAVEIPPGGLYFDASPSRGEIPMTGSSDYFLGKRYFFVDYRTTIRVRRNVTVDPTHWTGVGNHLYRLAAPPIPKVVPNPVVLWKTYDGVSIRPWAFTQRWEKSGGRLTDQTPMTYLQGVIASVSQKPPSIHYRSLSGTSISREWWASRKVFFGDAAPGRVFTTSDGIVRIGAISSSPSGPAVDIQILPKGEKSETFRLEPQTTPGMPEDAQGRSRMIARSGRLAVVLWPKDPIRGKKARLWVYADVREWKTNAPFEDLSGWNYFPIACPIAHHIGGMIYNDRPIRLRPGRVVPVFGGYARLTVVSIHSGTVKFRVGSRNRWTPVLSKRGNIDSVFGEGRAVHGILNTLNQTEANLAGHVTFRQN